jgi:hypothetical protein
MNFQSGGGNKPQDIWFEKQIQSRERIYLRVLDKEDIKKDLGEVPFKVYTKSKKQLIYDYETEPGGLFADIYIYLEKEDEYDFEVLPKEAKDVKLHMYKNQLIEGVTFKDKDEKRLIVYLEKDQPQKEK